MKSLKLLCCWFHVCLCCDFRPALYFYIKSHDDPRQVLDIQGADPKPGAKVIIYGNKGDLADNQLWYEDQIGIIRSKMNDFVIDASGKYWYFKNMYPIK